MINQGKRIKQCVVFVLIFYCNYALIIIFLNFFLYIYTKFGFYKTFIKKKTKNEKKKCKTILIILFEPKLYIVL